MNAQRSLLRERTKAHALRVISVVENLPRTKAADVIGGQLIRSGTSVGANYRTACRARSAAEFCARLGVVEEETDESLYWMELLIDSGIMKEKRLEDLMQEGDEILSMVIASIQTTRRTSHKKRPPK